MPPFDPAGATSRLVDSLGAAALARSEAFTREANWLLIGGVLLWIAVATIAVRSGAMARLEAVWNGRPRWLATFVATFVFFVACDLVRLPWTVFANWWHPRRFGLSSQSLGDYIGQAELSSLLDALIVAMFITALFGLIRSAGRRWWLAAGGISSIGIVLLLLLGPVLFQPLFNEYRPMPPGPVRAELELLADSVGIPRDRIFLYNGSRQSEAFSANVSGIGPGARIALSDVALSRATHDEIRAVTAHEAGHYVLGHVWWRVVVFPLLAVLGFALIARFHPVVAQVMGSDASIGEPRSLPVFVAMVAVLGLMAAPLVNAMTRTAEREADRYALEATNLPDALASALLKTAEYRYPRPSVFEEVLFYAHPSLERRIRAAMDWKAAHPSPTAPGR